MAIYDIDGASLQSVYDVDGIALNQAYDINQNPLINLDYDLKVMTYNVRWFTDFNGQQEMQNTIINGNDADIIGFQEITKTGTVNTVGTNALSNYPYFQLSNHTNYIALASKKALSNITATDFTNQDPNETEKRAYMMAEFDVDGTTVTWINTHLCYKTATASVTARYAQMTEIFNIAQTKDHVIITGDFNCYCEAIGDSVYNGLYKMFVDADYNLADCTQSRGIVKTWTNNTAPTSLNDFNWPADNIITSSDIDIVTVKYDLTKLDYLNGQGVDHIPIVATLKIK